MCIILIKQYKLCYYYGNMYRVKGCLIMVFTDKRILCLYEVIQVKSPSTSNACKYNGFEGIYVKKQCYIVSN